MDFLQLAKERYSERKYLPKKIEPEKLAQILEAGRVAPTAANLQPQRIIVVQKPEGLERVRKAANTYGAPLVLIVCSDREQSWTRPLDQFKTTEIDATIATDHMMLEVASLGLASVWICYFKADVIRKEFALPDNIVPLNILAIGYAAGEGASPNRHDKMRKPLQDMVFYENF